MITRPLHFLHLHPSSIEQQAKRCHRFRPQLVLALRKHRKGKGRKKRFLKEKAFLDLSVISGSIHALMGYSIAIISESNVQQYYSP
jgi:hypothetical protein